MYAIIIIQYYLPITKHADARVIFIEIDEFVRVSILGERLNIKIIFIVLVMELSSQVNLWLPFYNIVN